MKILGLSSIGALLSVGFSLTASAATVVFIEDSMDNGSGDYTAFSFLLTGSGDHGASLSEEVSGGNPDAYLVLSNFYGSNFDSSLGSGQQAFLGYFPLTWNPSIQGEILSVSFSVDVLNLTPAFSTLGFTIDDINGGNGAGFTSLAPDSAWQTISTGPLANLDFSARDFAGNLALRFGIAAVSDKLDVDGVEETVAIGVDNFRVEIEFAPIPETGSFAPLAGLVALGFALLRRRR